jgi:hypothetical protein
MKGTDRQPLPNSPVTRSITQRSNNRFGAVISSLHGFWTARETAVRGRPNAGVRKDAYTIITFNSDASVSSSHAKAKSVHNVYLGYSIQ